MNYKTAFVFIISIASAMFSTLASAGWLDALANVGNAGRIETYQAVQDKELVDLFYTLGEGGKSEPTVKGSESKSPFIVYNLTPGTLTLRNFIYKADSLADIVATMREFTKSPMDDEIGQRYVAFAIGRGNIVKQYQPAMGEVLNRMFEQHFEFKPAANVIAFFKSENALIEYSTDGRIISVMIRAHQAIHNFNARSWQYVNIISGKNNMRIIENKLSASIFTETFQRIVTVDPTIAN